MSAEAPAPAPAAPLRGEPPVVGPPTRGELAWYRFARGAVMVPSWALWRMRFTGTENLPQTTPYVLAPVHRSYIDTLVAGYVSNRRVRFMGKEEMWQTPWVAKLFNSLGGFPVRRGTPDREALRICERDPRRRRAGRALPGRVPPVRAYRSTALLGAGLCGPSRQRAHRPPRHRGQ